MWKIGGGRLSRRSALNSTLLCVTCSDKFEHPCRCPHFELGIHAEALERVPFPPRGIQTPKM